MPADALPQPRVTPAALPGAVRLHREYRDAFGRPLNGQARITGTARAQDGHRVTVAAPVNAEVRNGVLAVDLPPGSYTVAASLTTVDGHRADDTETVTLD